MAACLLRVDEPSMLSFVLKYKTSHVLAKIWDNFRRRNPNPHKSHVNSTLHRILVVALNK